MPSTKNALIVEDEQGLRELFTRYLEDYFQVITASSGGEAIEHITGGVDVLILDRGLPDMNGDDLLNQLDRKDEMTIIIVSGFEPDSGAKSSEYDKYLKKPVTRSDLLEALGVEHGKGSESQGGKKPSMS